MDLVILHYHLNRGGVTSVIENHLRALARLATGKFPRRVAIAFGGRSAAWDRGIQDELPFEVRLVAVPELDYDNETTKDADRLHLALQRLLTDFDCTPGSTVLHVHNHSLGKNAAMPSTLCRLASDGWHLLLQIHDFAEDLRPTNYRHMLDMAGGASELHQQLYPQANHIHYATLNQRDQDVLLESNIEECRLHLLPNAVVTTRTPSGKDETSQAREKLEELYGVPAVSKYVLYPVRAIRRKNIGELLLWSVLAKDVAFAVTLAPLNPTEIPTYEAWVALAESLRLPVWFDVGSELTLNENYAAADAIITTSVAEGFGLVYLEAAMAGRPLFGRDLPGVTDDFRANGMRFPGLVDSIRIPCELINVQKLKQTLQDMLRDLRADFGFHSEMEESAVASLAGMFHSDTVDFGRLDSGTQRLVLRRVSERADLRHAVRALNPIMATMELSDGDVRSQTLDENCRVIDRCYSLDVIGSRLFQVYQTVLGCNPDQVEFHPRVAISVLNSFALPDRLFPIRLES